jgi:hypothetical protein
MEKILIILFILFSNINNIESKEIEMYLRWGENYDLQKLVGKNGFISFIAHYNFDEIKINKTNDKWKPYFELKIYDERNINYYIKCGPWNGGNFLFIFCKFNETFPEGEYTFDYFEKNKNKFNYAGYEINLYQHGGVAHTIDRKKINDEILDLYCPPQTINVTDDEEDPVTVPSGIIEWNSIDHNFLQYDYPTATKIIPGEGMDIPAVLRRIVETCGPFNIDKFAGLKNPLLEMLNNLDRVKSVTGNVNSSITTRLYDLLDQLGIEVFCATPED